jgi:hypothetical protein
MLESANPRRLPPLATSCGNPVATSLCVGEGCFPVAPSFARGVRRQRSRGVSQSRLVPLALHHGQESPRARQKFGPVAAPLDDPHRLTRHPPECPCCLEAEFYSDRHRHTAAGTGTGRARVAGGIEPDRCRHGRAQYGAQPEGPPGGMEQISWGCLQRVGEQEQLLTARAGLLGDLMSAPASRTRTLRPSR